VIAKNKERAISIKKNIEEMPKLARSQVEGVRSERAKEIKSQSKINEKLSTMLLEQETQRNKLLRDLMFEDEQKVLLKNQIRNQFKLENAKLNHTQKIRQESKKYRKQLSQLKKLDRVEDSFIQRLKNTQTLESTLKQVMSQMVENSQASTRKMQNYKRQRYE